MKTLFHAALNGTKCSRKLISFTLFTPILFMMLVVSSAVAQTNPTPAAEDEKKKEAEIEEGVVEEIVVHGSRRIVRDQIQIKRESIIIADGL